jgi:MYXO-CTERM domain-containing protein
LPTRLGEAQQAAFVTKYGTTCVDPAVGTADPGSMFLFYRPAQPGCVLAAEDVSTFTATVSDSAMNTRGKYPEYHRLWADNALEIVSMFSHEYTTPTPGDEGVAAYDDFVWRVHQLLGELQPNDSLRSEPANLSPAGTGSSQVRLAALLPDGRSIAINVMLVGHALTDDGAAFDAWYDTLTPTADVILYNGHAGLGANVRTLMSKGSFVPEHYMIWFANGCDTFAYVDRTLVDRRALLNPEDPGGTKFMDTVTNVMAGYFRSLGPTSLTFLRALVDVRNPQLPPKTYEQIFQGIDPTQVVVVTGEEDNVLEPLPPAPNPGGAAGTSTSTSPTDPVGGSTSKGLPQGGAGDGPTTPSRAGANGTTKQGSSGCAVARGTGPHDAGSALGALALAGVATLALRRRRHRLRPPDAPH